MQLPLRQGIADRVWRWRKATYAASAMVVLAALAIVFLSIATPTTSIEVSTQPIFFDANRALRAAQDLSRLYPNRSLGSEDAAGSVAWLTDKLKSLGVDFAAERQAVRFGQKPVTLENVWAILPGTSNETIVLSASRDLASDVDLPDLAQATSTAILLDLVQVFAAHPHEKTLVFLSTEGGAYGGLGLAAFLDSYPNRSLISSVLSIQSLGMEDRTFLYAATIGPGTATPGWLVDVTSRVLARTNLELHLPNLHEQIASQALRLQAGDQVAGLQAGIASLLLHDQGEGTVTAAALGTQGAALERLLLTLDEAGNLPKGPSTAFVLGSGKYISSRLLTILAAFLILPSLAMTAIWLMATRLPPSGWVAHIRNAASFVLPGLALLLLAFAAARLGLIPLYARQAVPMLPEAIRPRWSVGLGLLAAGLVLFFLIRHFLGYLRPIEERARAETAKLTCAFTLLSIGLVLIAAGSPFSLVPVLSAAWIWPLCTAFLEPPSLAVPWWPSPRSNAWIALLGLTGPLAFYAYLAANTEAGWSEAWWLVLVQVVSGAHGLSVPVGAVCLAASFLMLLGSRRVPLEPLESLPRTEDAPWTKAPPRVVKVTRRTQSPGGRRSGD